MNLTREQIAARAAMELKDGDYINLGIGIPTLVGNYIPPDKLITLQSENGVMSMGPFPKKGKEDPDLIKVRSRRRPEGNYGKWLRCPEVLRGQRHRCGDEFV